MSEEELNQYVEIDDRIERIWQKMKQLPDEIKFPCGTWPPVWELPLSEEERVQFETEKGIHLPKDYRRFVTTKTAGGTQPFYGLYNPVKPVPSYECDPVPEKKFPYTMEKPLILAELSEEEQNQYFENDDFSYGELTEGSFKNMF